MFHRKPSKRTSFPFTVTFKVLYSFKILILLHVSFAIRNIIQMYT